MASADATDAIMRSVREFGQRILDAAWVDRAVTRLGVDETAFLAATARAHTQFITGLAGLAPAGGGPATGCSPPVAVVPNFYVDVASRNNLTLHSIKW